MSRENGSIIGVDNIPTTTSASGIWSLNAVSLAVKNSIWPEAVPPPGEPNFNQTVLLLHGDGTNGAQNNTFLDSSTNNFTITRNGNTTQGTFSPFSAPVGEWSVASDGSGDNLSIAYNSALDVTQGDFTVEFWIYRTVGGVQLEVINQRGSTIGWIVRINSNDTIVFAYAGSGATVTSIGTIPLNEWVHVAGAREGNTIRVFINGVLDNTGSGGNGTTSTATFYINRSYTSSGGGVTGYLSNLRIVKGTALYTATFTVPTAPLTAVSGTSLLTLQNNRFVDNSTNNFAITAVGNIAASSFSPFAPTAAYSAGTNGGSGYFDGTGDYLSIADAAGLEIGSSQFCIESWIYLDSLPASGSLYAILSKWGALGSRSYIFQVQNNSGTMRFALSYSADGSAATDLFQNAAITAGTWHHVAVTRDSSNNVRFFLDGVAQGSATTVSTTFNNNAQQVEIGRHGSAINLFPGYISNCRLVIGSAVYTSGFTPTGPLTAITNTSLLLNFTNAGIFDNTGKNNLETVGNAQIDTTTKKYGTGSMEFDGTGDYLQSAAGNPDFNFGTGDFTIEFWLYANATTNGVASFGSTGTITSGSNLQYDIVFVSNALRFRVMTGSTIITVASPSVSTSTWTHFALVRSGSTFTVYKDGVSQGTGSTSGALNFNTAWVFRAGAGAGNAATFLDGLIDDLRITKGVARYTANFTPPTAAFPDQ